MTNEVSGPDDDVLGCLGHRSAAEHRALVLRTSCLDDATYGEMLRAYADATAGATEPLSLGSLDQALAHAAAAFLPRSPHEAPVPALPASPCPACGALVLPSVARVIAEGDDLVYASCGACGHGVLVAGMAPPTIYDAAYHRARSPAGAGYAAYADEAIYRENKGERLLERLGAFASPGQALLEIGSGYGYTRIAAERRGVRTTGVDPSPGAAGEARDRYGLSTFVGTLAEAIDAGAVQRGAYDLALYQFVLEHIVDPLRELRLAASSVRAGGRVAVVVPNMAAAERHVFGAAYRSFRADHVHLFTRASLALFARRAGLSLSTCESVCNLHLLVDFVPPPLLAALYARGDGPDLIATFVKEVE